MTATIDPRTVPVRYSRLKLIGQSPAHYLHAVQAPDDGDSLALRLGKGTHALLFGKRVAVWTGKVRSGKAWEAFEAEQAAAGAEILNEREYGIANGMAESLLRHHDARSLIFSAGAQIERRVQWSIGGRACVGTPDAFTSQKVIDLKTTRSAAPDRFCRDATFRGYHAQLAWYMDGLAAAGVAEPCAAYIVAIESAPPHPVVVLELTERALDMGRRLYRLWWERLMTCEQSDAWPGYAETVLPFDLDAPVELDGLVDDEEGAAA